MPGSLKVCARESPRSVGSVVSTNCEGGQTMARERIIMAAPTAAEPVVMVLKPRLRITSPVLALSMATDQPVVMTAMRMGQKRARTLTGRNPTRMNPSSSRAKRIPEVSGRAR